MKKEKKHIFNLANPMPWHQGIEIVNNDYQNKGKTMKKTDEQKLIKLLKSLYGKNWLFNWQGQDNGFELILQVWKGKKWKTHFIF